MTPMRSIARSLLFAALCALSGAAFATDTAPSSDAVKALTPDGVIRAIAEHSFGEHQPEAFDRVRNHYAAIAESVIRRDEIPLTRRDFIQRYFEALRNQPAPQAASPQTQTPAQSP